MSGLKLKPGDSVSLSISPSIEIAPYTHAKPFASVTRVIGDDTDCEVADMKVQLRHMLYHALTVQLGVQSELEEVFADGSIEGLAAYAQGVCRGEKASQEVSRVESPTAKGKQTKRGKVAKKKARRKAK